MHITNQEQLINLLSNIKENEWENVFITGCTEIFNKILIQPLIRVVENQTHTFLSVRVIEIQSEQQGKGYFKQIYQILSSYHLPLLFDNVVNHKLDQFLDKEGFKSLITEKYDCIIKSRYKF